MPLNRAPLLNIGLSDREIDVYLQLLKSGPCRAGALIKATNSHNSVMHMTLGRLVAKGVISYVLCGKTKTYTATSPTRLLEMADQQRKRLEELVPDLMALRETAPTPNAEVYEGLSGLKNMCFSLIDGAEPGDEYLFFGFHSPSKEFEDEVYSFYREFTQVRIERGLALRGIAHESMKEIFKRYRWPHKNIKFIQHPILQNISVCRDRAIVVPWNDTRTSFMLTSRGFTDNVRDYFNSLWAEG